MADKTKAEFLQELKDANTKIYDNVNGARIEITGSEFDARLDDKAQGLYDSQEYDKIVTNGKQYKINIQNHDKILDIYHSFKYNNK
jgi:hypothetical protein